MINKPPPRTSLNWWEEQSTPTAFLVPDEVRLLRRSEGGKGVVSTSWEMEFKRNNVDLIWNELLFLLFNELLFFLLPNQKSTTTSNKHIPLVSWIFRFETGVPGPNPRLGAGLILDGFGSSKPSRIWGWYACVTYTFNIYSYVIYQSNCAHLASFFFFPQKWFIGEHLCRNRKRKSWKSWERGRRNKNTQSFATDWCCLRVDVWRSGHLGWKKNILCRCTNSRMVGCRIYSSSTRTWHEVVTCCLKMKRDRMRGIWNRKIHFYMETINEQLYISYIMSMIHHLNSDAFLIPWYVYMYIYRSNITFHVSIYWPILPS